MKILKLNLKKNKAQAIVEFAIALPILLLILYGVMEAGRYILIVSSVNNATRQAARYGSTSGVNPTTGVPRYQDCQGIKDAALKTNFMRSFTSNDITVTYDAGPGTAAKAFSPCNGATDTGVDPSTNNSDRITVSISARYNAIVPRLVPFVSRTMNASSSRTIVRSITIQQAPATPKETTTTTVTGPSSSEIGQLVTFSTTVAGTTTPTGSVVFKDTTNNVTLCTVTLSSGAATCAYTFTTLGTRTITVEYAGDTTHNSSTGTLAHTVNKASVIVTITADSPDPSAANATLTSVAVSVTSAWGTPTGTVAITGANTNCTITLSGGSGSCNTVKFTSTGSKTLTATYTPTTGTNHLGGTDTEAHTVATATATTTVINNPASSASLTVTFSTTVSGLTTPAGSVVFKQGTTTLCTVTLSGGSGTCTYTFTTSGAKNITASYTSTNGMAASSATQTITVGATTTTITAGTPVNGAVTFTAAVTGNGTLTGSVAIKDSANTTLCTITLPATTCSYTFPSSVTNATITGTYSGDSTHTGSSGTTNVTVTVSNISCAISSYAVNNWNDGNGGFGATLGIKNTGTTTINSGWTLTWNFPSTQTVTGMWNPSSYTQSGKLVTATNGPQAINAGATFSSMGFNGTGAVPYPTNNYPVDFKLNGTACTPPPVTNCSSSTVVLSKLKLVSGNLTLPINNTLPSALRIKDVTINWYQLKGHGTTTDKTLTLKTALIGTTNFWTGSETVTPKIIIPATPTYIPPGASNMTFTYHQTQTLWSGDYVSITLSTPGCETVVLSQTLHE